MNQILIPFECDCDFDTRDIVLSINDNPVDHQIENNIIIIDNDIGMGLNLLEIKLIGKKENFVLKIKDFILNKVSSRQTLYLAFSQLEGKNFCTTWLTDRDNIITIPFGNPMSWWLSECAKKIPNMSYGTNLYDQYTIFYPKSIEIDNGFPRIMQDFMKHNLGFHVVAKTEYENPLHNKKIPYLRVDLDYDEDALFDEFSRNIDLLESDDFSPKQNEYNSREIEKLDLWQISLAVRPNKSENRKGWKDTIIYKQEQFPLLYKLLEQITDVGDVRIIIVFIGQVKPHSYVAPHVDDLYKHRDEFINTGGCSQMFIPIKWKKGNYYKFNEVGLVPYDQGALIGSNSEFMHGSINNSDQTRFTIGIVCEFADNSFFNKIKDL